MSMTSKMVLFNQAPRNTLTQVIKDLLAKWNPDLQIYVSRYREPWARWQRIYVRLRCFKWVRGKGD